MISVASLAWLYDSQPLVRQHLLVTHLLQGSKPVRTKFSDKLIEAHSHRPVWVRVHNILSWETCASTIFPQLHFKGGELL